MSTPTVVILGAAFSGIPTAHKLLRSLPAEYKVILVNPSSQLYWNFAAPRVLAKDDQFSASNAQAFEPILPGFSSYAPTRFEFIQGKATSLDPRANTVVITPNDDEGTAGADRSIEYTHLVIATGSSAHDGWPFKSVGSHTQTQRAIAEVHAKVAAAGTIVFSGAGATGVETAGEFATLHKGSGKKIYLLSSADRPLAMVRADVGKSAQKQLESLGVVVKNGVRVTAETEKDGVKQLQLSDGETIQADLHIPTFGLAPNTQFVPEQLLDETRSVKVTAHMQSTEFENIWATGDAAGVKHKQSVAVKPMLDALVFNLLAAVKGEDKATFKEYKDEDTPIIVPIGGGFAMGTGLLGSWRVWGFLVWVVKGRSYFIGSAKNVALGKSFPTGAKV
jgi:NADH dehydrogenase FAD-containing subunit